jgi:hypothetical protein
MSDHPYTHEAVERWQQGKINIFDALAELEDQRDDFRRMTEDLLERNGKLAVNLDRVRTERNALQKATGYWATLQRWLDMVHDAYEGQDRDGLNQLYMRGPFAGWSQEKVVRLADELWENSQKYPFHPKEKQHE